MEFYVNNQKLDITLENEKTIGDVLKSFEAECSKNNATTIHITLNGNNIDATAIDSVCEMPLEESTKLELTVVSENELKSSLTNQKEVCQSLSDELANLSIKLQSGKDKEAGLLISKLADFIENFCHLAALSMLFPQLYERLSIDGKKINDFFQEFSGILNDFEQALSSQDTVLMGDLAEYEISPRLISIAKTIEEL